METRGEKREDMIPNLKELILKFVFSFSIRTSLVAIASWLANMIKKLKSL